MTLTKDGVASNADSNNTPSKIIAKIIADNLGAKIDNKLKGQTAGTLFEKITAQFIESTFTSLKHLRPGNWRIANLGNQNSLKISDFAQYEHLSYLADIIEKHKQLSTVLGNDYMISPDIVVYRELCEDEEINCEKFLIDDSICKMSDLRKKNGGKLSCTRLFLPNGLCAVIELKIAGPKL